MGVHHAREWPSAEAAIEYANLLAKAGSDRVRALLARRAHGHRAGRQRRRLLSSRDSAAIDPADAIRDANGGEEPTARDGPAALDGRVRRAARRHPDLPPQELRRRDPRRQRAVHAPARIDNNRNYGNLWGGNGASPDPTSQSYHGPGPRSEPETQAIGTTLARTRSRCSCRCTTSPRSCCARRACARRQGARRGADEGDRRRMGDATGYTSQYSFQLYDTAGTTEDDTYAATGGYGYTIEIGPANGAFHMPYETGFVKEWTGEAAGNGKGLQEALLIAADAAANKDDHALVDRVGTGRPRAAAAQGVRHADQRVLRGRHRPGRHRRRARRLPGGEQPPQTLHDVVDTTTVVPASGRFRWHINPSTRPFVGGGAVTEKLDDQPYDTQSSPATSDNRVPFEVTGDDADGAVKVTLAPTVPVEDYDLEVYRVEGGHETQVASSGNPPGRPRSRSRFRSRPRAATWRRSSTSRRSHTSGR